MNNPINKIVEKNTAWEEECINKQESEEMYNEEKLDESVEDSNEKI